MNNVANKLLRILYSLIHKGELYNRDYIRTAPRNSQKIRKERKRKVGFITEGIVKKKQTRNMQTAVYQILFQ